jgi:pimeloyl-ACP methyl ester carboxylesterase
MAPVRPPTSGRLFLGLALVAVGCSSITVRKADKDDALLDAWKASALAGDDLSPRSLQTLRRLGLEDAYRADPEDAIARLHALALQESRPEFLFALAEMSYLQGKRADRWDCAGAVAPYYLCAGYAYHYLFACADAPPQAAGDGGGQAGAAPPAPLAPADPFDPRFRLACDLYNASLSKCIVAAQRVGRLDSRQALRLPAGDGGAFTLSVTHAGFPWKPEEFGPLIPCENYVVDGLANQHHLYGLGVPLIAVRAADAPPPPHKYYPKKVSFPVTAFFRFEGGLAELGERRTGRLELYNPLAIQAVEVHGRAVPLETDLTTPLAYFLSDKNFNTAAYEGFLRADALRGRYGLHMLEPYQPGKIPVVLVHGLLSSPLTWMPVFNDLRADPELRKRFQFWFYFYPTGDPYIATAADLRRDLEAMRADLDPEHKDAALDRMVLVGHSMGGLVSKLLTVDSGDDFWRLVSDRPFGDLALRPQTRDELQRVFFFRRESCIERVIFLGTPHHGSRLSPSPLGRLGESLVRAPKDLMEAASDAAAENPALPALRRFESVPTSVDLLAPDAPALELLAARPHPSAVHYHSVIGVAPTRTIWERLLAGDDQPGDGIVPYKSAHLDDAESELIVPADHFHVHQHPLAVLEIRRILLEHAREGDDGVVPAGATDAGRH